MSSNAGWRPATSLILYALCLWSAQGCGDNIAAIEPVVVTASDSARPPSSPTPDSAGIPVAPIDTATRVAPDTTTRITPPDTAPPARPHLVTLRVGPSGGTLQAGATELLQASGTMSDGTIAGAIAITWTALGGTVSSTGTFTAGIVPGPAMVTATSGTVSASAQLTVVPPPEPDLPAFAASSADDFVNSIGVNVHLGYFGSPYGTAWQGVIVPRLVELGVRHLRDGGTILGDDGWMTSVYGRMNELATHGLKFDLVLSPPQGSTDYTNYTQLGRLLQFAGSSVESVEGLNEHDLSGRANWVAETRTFQAAIFAAIRQDPRTVGMPVFGPSMGHPVNGSAVGDLSQLLDVGSIHPYPGGNVPMTNLTDHENRTRVISGGHLFAATETGYHNALLSTSDNRPVTEDAAGRYIPRLLLDNFMAGVVRTYLYELIDEGVDPANQEQNFGLLRNDGSEKPAFIAVRNLISLLADPGPSFSPAPLHLTLSGDTVGVKYLVLAKRDGRYDLVLWQETSSYNLAAHAMVQVANRSVTVQLQHNPLVTVFTPGSTPTPLAPVQRRTSLVLSVPDTPVVVEIAP